MELDPRTGRHRAFLACHRARGGALTPGARVGVFDAPDGLRVVDLATVETRHRAPPLPDRAWLLAASPQADRVAYTVAPPGRRGEYTCPLWLRDVRTGRDALLIDGEFLHAASVAFTSDGRQVLVAQAGRLVRYDATTAEALGSVPVGRGFASIVEVSAADIAMALVDEELLVRWHLGGDRVDVAATFDARDGAFRARCTGERAVSVHERDGGAAVRWYARGAVVAERHVEAPWHTLSIAPGLDVVAGVADGTLVWFTPDSDEAHGTGDHLRELRALAFSADSRRLAACDFDAAVVWDVASGARAWTLEGGSCLDALCFHPAGTELYALDGGGDVVAWELARGVERGRCKGAPVGGSQQPDGRIHGSPDGAWIVVERDGLTTVRFDDVSPSHFFPWRVAAAGFDASGALVAVSHSFSLDDEESVRRFHRDGREELVGTRRITASTFDAALSPDGRTLVSFRDAHTPSPSRAEHVAVVDVASVRTVRLLPVWAMEDGPDIMGVHFGERWLTVAHRGRGAVMRWRLDDDGPPVVVDLGPEARGLIRCVAVSRDDRLVAVALATGMVLVLAEPAPRG